MRGTGLSADLWRRQDRQIAADPGPGHPFRDGVGLRISWLWIRQRNFTRDQ